MKSEPLTSRERRLQLRICGNGGLFGVDEENWKTLGTSEVSGHKQLNDYSWRELAKIAVSGRTFSELGESYKKGY